MNDWKQLFLSINHAALDSIITSFGPQHGHKQLNLSIFEFSSRCFPDMHVSPHAALHSKSASNLPLKKNPQGYGRQFLAAFHKCHSNPVLRIRGADCNIKSERLTQLPFCLEAELRFTLESDVATKIVHESRSGAAIWDDMEWV